MAGPANGVESTGHCFARRLDVEVPLQGILSQPPDSEEDGVCASGSALACASGKSGERKMQVFDARS